MPEVMKRGLVISKRDVPWLLDDILDATEKILTYTNDLSFIDFMSDDKTMDAVIRNFQIIGEAIKKLPENFKLKHQEVEWHRAVGFRNRIVHGYFEINYEILWDIKEEDVPELMKQIEMLIKDLS